MVLVSYSGREINAKLVYYGPGLSGKTTNLEYIYGSIPQTQRGKMVSMKTKTERTLFFDFLPVNLGELSGFKTRFLLYTVPGQVYYNATRKLVLKGVDAVVFVADSKRGKMDENVESLENLRENLRECGLEIDQVPWVIQYNKRDLTEVYSVPEMDRILNPGGVPIFEAVATTGQGVVETFKSVSRLLLRKLAKEIGVQVVSSAPRDETVPNVGASAPSPDEAARAKVATVASLDEVSPLAVVSMTSRSSGFDPSVEAERLAPAEPSEPTQWPAPVEQSESTHRSEPAEQSEPTQRSEPAEPIQWSKPVEHSEPAMWSDATAQSEAVWRPEMTEQPEPAELRDSRLRPQSLDPPRVGLSEQPDPAVHKEHETELSSEIGQTPLSVGERLRRWFSGSENGSGEGVEGGSETPGSTLQGAEPAGQRLDATVSDGVQPTPEPILPAERPVTAEPVLTAENISATEPAGTVEPARPEPFLVERVSPLVAPVPLPVEPVSPLVESVFAVVEPASPLNGPATAEGDPAELPGAPQMVMPAIRVPEPVAGGESPIKMGRILPVPTDKRVRDHTKPKPREIVVPLTLEERDLATGIVVKFAFQISEAQEGDGELEEAA